MPKINNESYTKDAICGDGMCPYIPCKDYPKCNHIEKILKENKMNEEKRTLTVSFSIDKEKVGIIVSSNKVSPQEGIGLLEMAKEQFLEKLRQNKKDIFELDGDSSK